MMRRITLKSSLIALWCLVAAGCAKVPDEAAKDAATAEEAAIAPEPAAVATVAPVPADAGTLGPAPLAPVASLTGGRQDPIDDPSATSEVQLPPSSVSPAELPLAALERPVVAPAAPAAREPERGSDPSASSVVAPLAAETLDFTSLFTRLRKTRAINLRTKLAVRNESDDLLERLRVYHARHGTATLADLQRSYDSLFLKLYSLLEDADPSLARDIDRSRAAIWAILADPMKFGASALVVSTRSVPPT
jgi:hypothetical protein